MKVIREATEKHCVVRSDCYDSRLSHFQLLFRAAQKDFPELTPEQVQVKHYGGQRYKGTFGIEFELVGPVPGGYRSIKQLECTL